MLTLNPNITHIEEEGAFAVLDRALALKAKGAPVINLGIGQPDFAPPAHVLAAAEKAARDGPHGYTSPIGIPALREGNIIELAALKLQVVEACSGIRSLMTLATLAVVYGYFFESQWWRWVVLVLAVLPIAVLTNAARVAVTGILAHTWGAAVAEGFLHGFSGTLVFVAAVLLLLACGKALDLAAKLWVPRRVASRL